MIGPMRLEKFSLPSTIALSSFEAADLRAAKHSSRRLVTKQSTSAWNEQGDPGQRSVGNNLPVGRSVWREEMLVATPMYRLEPPVLFELRRCGSSPDGPLAASCPIVIPESPWQHSAFWFLNRADE